MKLIRLTDDRYVLDCGSDLRRDEMEHLRSYWEDYWKPPVGDFPPLFVVGGVAVPLEYEDRRDPDAIQMARIEEKLDRILEALS